MAIKTPLVPLDEAERLRIVSDIMRMRPPALGLYNEELGGRGTRTVMTKHFLLGVMPVFAHNAHRVYHQNRHALHRLYEMSTNRGPLPFIAPYGSWARAHARGIAAQHKYNVLHERGLPLELRLKGRASGLIVYATHEPALIGDITPYDFAMEYLGLDDWRELDAETRRDLAAVEGEERALARVRLINAEYQRRHKAAQT